MGRMAVVAMFVAACGGPSVTGHDAAGDTTSPDTGPDPNDGAHSGTRLKLTYWVFADGTRQWNEFYDEQRKETCFPYANWPDGNTYCTPDAASITYRDAACSQKIADVYGQAGCVPPTPTYALEYAYQPCTSGPTHLYQVGSRLLITQYYYKGSDGSCSGPYSSPNDFFYTLGAEVMPTDLVKMSIGAPTTGNRISERPLTTSDGLSIPWRLHDAQLGDDCYANYWQQGAQSAQCTPADTEYAGYAHDSACSMMEVDVQKACTPGRYAVTYPYSACPATPSQYSMIGALAASAPLYFPSQGMCYATTAQATENYFSVGTQLSLASLMRAPEPVTGHRMQLIYESTADGLRWRDYSIYDSQQQTECGPVSLADGSTRCIPYGGYAQTYYTSSTCATPIDLVEVQTGPATCGAPSLPKFANKYVPPTGGGTCGYDYEVHTMGAEYTAGVYTNYGSCALYKPTQTKFYRLGPTVDTSVFATATVLTDQ